VRSHPRRALLATHEVNAQQHHHGAMRGAQRRRAADEFQRQPVRRIGDYQIVRVGVLMGEKILAGTNIPLVNYRFRESLLKYATVAGAGLRPW